MSEHKPLTAAEIAAVERFFRESLAIKLQSEMHPEMFDRLIATARRSIPDETPLDEEWMNNQGGWRMHEAMQSYIRDFGDVRLTIDVPLGGSRAPWAAWVERTNSGVRSLVRINDITTRAQLAALVSAMGGGA